MVWKAWWWEPLMDEAARSELPAHFSVDQTKQREFWGSPGLLFLPSHEDKSSSHKSSFETSHWQTQRCGDGGLVPLGSQVSCLCLRPCSPILPSLSPSLIRHVVMWTRGGEPFIKGQTRSLSSALCPSPPADAIRDTLPEGRVSRGFCPAFYSICPDWLRMGKELGEEKHFLMG